LFRLSALRELSHGCVQNDYYYITRFIIEFKI